MTASQNVIIELQKLGLELDVSPNKLKSGYGEGVCTVLLKLTEVSLQNKFRFKKPKIQEESKGLEDDVDDGDDMDGGADLADMIAEGEGSDDDIDEDLDFGGGNIQADLAREMEADMQANAIIQSSISKEKWQLEVEGIAHKLKINKNAGEGGKEWRTHLE